MQETMETMHSTTDHSRSWSLSAYFGEVAGFPVGYFF